MGNGRSVAEGMGNGRSVAEGMGDTHCCRVPMGAREIIASICSISNYKSGNYQLSITNSRSPEC
ncbi:MAG: hypothetical protein HC942_15405 [Microcoleus sp. SU_5_6]|nr:hypothetical protein [Microcoleus sp. SU_5_6]